MSEWEPATEGEAAMREALAVSDQELYFRVLERSELLLPVSADALAGRTAMGWGTWTTSNRTHVLAFTSPAAMTACLNDGAASYRLVPFQSLATEWPNYEWWLAVNPGLPIEAFLPSWFVAQLSRGDVRLPGRTMGARARIAQHDLAQPGRVRAATGTATAHAVTVGPAMGLGPAATAPSATSMPTIVTPATAASATAASADHGAIVGDHPVETVDAEILDPAPAFGSARVYPAGGQGSAAVALEAGTALAAGPGPGDRDSTGRGVPTQPISTPTLERPPSQSRPANESRPGTEDAEIVSPPQKWAAGFVPANETESALLAAAEQSNTDAFLSTLLLARVILPVPAGTPTSARPRDPDFPWQIDEVDGQPFVSVFTSPERLGERSFTRFGSLGTSVSLRFVQLIASWPGEGVSFAINPGSPVGATLPGAQIVALAAWAAEVGLRDEPSAEVAVAIKKPDAASSVGVAGAPTTGAEQATVMQRAVLPDQLAFYLERGYDRVSGFVNRASEMSHLATPKALYRALGLLYPGSPFNEDDAEVHVLRWIAHRSGLYRLPYGGPHEAAMRAMQGWVIERPPFRGNGFAPGDTDVIAEFKVDSIRLPHGAQMWRLDKTGAEALVATFDADAARWMPAAAYYGGRYA